MSEEKIDRVLKGLAKVYRGIQSPEYRGPTMNFYQPSGGQLQFSCAPPRYKAPEKSGPDDAGVAWSSKMGAIFIEAAPPNENKDGKLDWKNKKMVFAMSDKDIGEVLWGLACKSGDIRIVHAPEDDAKNNNKTFRLQKGKEFKGQPQWVLSLTEKKNGVDTKVSVFIKGPDLMRLKTLLEQGLPYIMGCHRT